MKKRRVSQEHENSTEFYKKSASEPVFPIRKNKRRRKTSNYELSSSSQKRQLVKKKQPKDPAVEAFRADYTSFKYERQWSYLHAKLK